MDELNKRVLSIMDAKHLSKSSFANLLEISLPVLTHISSGRNKPGLDLIQKILTKFPDVSPDWLLLGQLPMYREPVKKVDLEEELKSISLIINSLPSLSANAKQVEDYHALLLKEILYLNDLMPFLKGIQAKSVQIAEEMHAIKRAIDIKLKD
jgi:hypothetical protein